MDRFEFRNTLAYPAPEGRFPGELVAVAVAAVSLLLSVALSAVGGDSPGYALSLAIVLLLFVCLIALVVFAIMCIVRIYRLSTKKERMEKEPVLTEVRFSGKKISVTHWKTTGSGDAKAKEMLGRYSLKPSDIEALYYDESKGMLEIHMADQDGDGTGTRVERWYPMADADAKASLLERFSRYADDNLQGRADPEALLASAGVEWERGGSQPLKGMDGNLGKSTDPNADGNQGWQSAQATVIEPRETDQDKVKPYKVVQSLLMIAGIALLLYFGLARDDGMTGAILFIVLFATSFVAQILGVRAGKVQRNAHQRAAICEGELEFFSYMDRQGPDSDMVTYSFYFTPDATEAPRITSIGSYELEGKRIVLHGDFRKTDLCLQYGKAFHEGIMAGGPVPYDLPWRGPDTDEVSEIVIERDFKDEKQLLDLLDSITAK